MDNSTICLLDISGFIYRAYYASPHVIYNNREVGALFGFCSEMLKILSIFNNAIFIAAMDSAKHTFINPLLISNGIAAILPMRSLRVRALSIRINWKRLLSSHLASASFRKLSRFLLMTSQHENDRASDTADVS